MVVSIPCDVPRKSRVPKGEESTDQNRLNSSNQVVGSVKRGTLTAFAVSCGQLGGIISALVYPSKDSPQYVPGISTCIAFQAAGILAAANMWFQARRENKLRDAGGRDNLRELSEEELSKLGDKHPDFRYTL